MTALDPRVQPERDTDLDSWTDAEKLVCAVAVFALGIRLFLTHGFTPGILIALGLLPVWVRAIRRFNGAVLLLVLGALAYLSGLSLAVLSSVDHAVSIGTMTYDTALLAGILCGIGTLLWARSFLSVSFIGALYGTGMLIGALLNHSAFTANPWKTAWAIPLGIILLSLVNRPHRKALELGVLLMLATVSILFDSRSYLATFLLAALLVAWQMRPAGLSRRGSWGWSAALMGGLTVVIYNLGSALLVDGYLGAEAQQRSQQQIDTAGSLILGGRPEIAATLALMREKPFGFGLGVAPSSHDVLVAKSGLASINYDPNNGYVERYMFGGYVELHSMFGDLWARLGILGLLLTAVITFLLIRSISQSVAQRTGSGVVLFLSCWSLWNVLYSPLYSSAMTLILALGLGLTRSDKSGSISKSNLPQLDLSST